MGRPSSPADAGGSSGDEMLTVEGRSTAAIAANRLINLAVPRGGGGGGRNTSPEPLSPHSPQQEPSGLAGSPTGHARGAEPMRVVHFQQAAAAAAAGGFLIPEDAGSPAGGGSGAEDGAAGGGGIYEWGAGPMEGTGDTEYITRDWVGGGTWKGVHLHARPPARLPVLQHRAARVRACVRVKRAHPASLGRHQPPAPPRAGTCLWAGRRKAHARSDTRTLGRTLARAGPARSHRRALPVVSAQHYPPRSEVGGRGWTETKAVGRAGGDCGQSPSPHPVAGEYGGGKRRHRMTAVAHSTHTLVRSMSEFVDMAQGCLSCAPPDAWLMARACPSICQGRSLPVAPPTAATAAWPRPARPARCAPTQYAVD